MTDGVEGLCHTSEAVDEHGAAVKLEPGSENNFRILKMSPQEKKIGLSLRAVGQEGSRTEVEAYKHSASSATSTIEELMSLKRAGNGQN